MRNVPEPQRHCVMRWRNAGSSAAESMSFVYRSFGFRFETTALARNVSPDSVIAPTARPFSTMISRTPASSANVRAAARGRFRHRLRDRAHAADRVTPRAFLAVDLAEHVMQQHVGGARRIRARVVADDAVEAEHRLDRCALEPTVEKIARGADEQAQQIATRFHARAA